MLNKYKKYKNKYFNIKYHGGVNNIIDDLINYFNNNKDSNVVVKRFIKSSGAASIEELVNNLVQAEFKKIHIDSNHIEDLAYDIMLSLERPYTTNKLITLCSQNAYNMSFINSDNVAPSQNRVVPAAAAPAAAAVQVAVQRPVADEKKDDEEEDPINFVSLELVHPRNVHKFYDAEQSIPVLVQHLKKIHAILVKYVTKLEPNLIITNYNSMTTEQKLSLQRALQLRNINENEIKQGLLSLTVLNTQFEDLFNIAGCYNGYFTNVYIMNSFRVLNEIQNIHIFIKKDQNIHLYKYNTESIYIYMLSCQRDKLEILETLSRQPLSQIHIDNIKLQYNALVAFEPTQIITPEWIINQYYNDSKYVTKYKKFEIMLLFQLRQTMCPEFKNNECDDTEFNKRLTKYMNKNDNIQILLKPSSIKVNNHIQLNANIFTVIVKNGDIDKATGKKINVKYPIINIDGYGYGLYNGKIDLYSEKMLTLEEVFITFSDWALSLFDMLEQLKQNYNFNYDVREQLLIMSQYK